LEEFFKAATLKRDRTFKLNIAEEILDPFPWDTVTLLKKDLQQPEDLTKGWLLSEVEHRTSTPGSLDRLLNWIYLAWDKGIQLPKTVVGMFSSALVDRTLLEDEASIYPKFFRYRLGYLKDAKDPLTTFFVNVTKPLLGGRVKAPEKKEAEIYEILFERRVDAETKLRLLLDSLPEEIRSQRERKVLQGPLTYGSVSEETPPFAISAEKTDSILRTIVSLGATPTRLKQFLDSSPLCLTSSLEFEEEAKRFDDFLKEDIGQLQALARYPKNKMLYKTEKADDVVSQFISKLKEQHIPVNVGDRIRYRRFLQDTLDSMSRRDTMLTQRERRHLLRNMTKLYLSNVFIEVAMDLRGFRTQYIPPPMGAWKIGDNIKSLSIPDTYRMYGMFIPGIFAMKRFEFTQKREAANICVLMDISGSTAMGNKINSIREAVFCLIEACRFMSDNLTFIPFSSNVDEEHIRRYTQDYEGVEDIVISIEPSGYTNIVPALLTALRTAEDAAYQNTFIFTDGGVWDGESAHGILEALARYGKVYLFLIGEKLDYLHEEAKGLAGIAVVHECKADRSLLEEPLQEYFNK
jgi:hypothetical protein